MPNEILLLEVEFDFIFVRGVGLDRTPCIAV